MSIEREALASSLQKLAGRGSPTSAVPALQEIVSACVDLFGVTGSGVMIADEQNITRFIASSDVPGRFLEEAESRTGQGVCTQAFVESTVVRSSDLAADPRWPELAAAVTGRGIHAVLGVPIRMGAISVGTLDVYRDHPHDWTEQEARALSRYADVAEVTLTAAMEAHTAGELAEQLQYALDYRVVIERAVGYLMAQGHVDSVTAFNRLRRVARSNRTKIGQVAEQLLRDGRLPATS